MNASRDEVPERPRTPVRQHRQSRLAARRLYNVLRFDLLRGSSLPSTETGFPDELAIMRDYRYSRDVVRDALAALAADGLIERRRGVGTRPTGAIRGLTTVALAPEILQWQYVRTPPPIAEALAPSASTESLCIDYVLRAGELPVAAFTNFVRFEESTDLDPEVFEAGFRTGAEEEEAAESYDLILQSMEAGPLVSELLEIRTGTPVLWFEQLIRDRERAVIDVAIATFRPEVRFSVPDIYRGMLAPVVSLFLTD
jgi:GntR family transcriptional regulator